MKIALVTTFNEKLYEYYAHRFIATYCWPFDCYITTKAGHQNI